MNTHTEYRRHGYQQPEPQAAQTRSVASELARHRDPSLEAATRVPAAAHRHLAWVRPTELASYAAPMVGRGIDLHTELLRRARRAPVSTTRALRHPVSTTAPPRSPQCTEGIQL